MDAEALHDIQAGRHRTSSVAGCDRTGHFAPLPASDRDAFKTGLENAVSFAEQHRMTELYAIWDNEENITLDRFEAMYGTTPPLTSFIPMKIRFVPSRGFWWVDGCATFSRSPYGKKSMYSTMQARKSVDGWRFSMVAVTFMQRGDPQPVNCKTQGS
jgi:hypothetical protein